MMGNIGLTKHGIVLEKKEANEIIDDLVKDLDIETVLGHKNNKVHVQNTKDDKNAL